MWDQSPVIIQTTDGGYILAGSVESRNGDITCTIVREDLWLAKLDNAGNIQWQRFLGGTGRDELKDIQLTADGGYIVAGSSSSVDGDICSNKGNQDFFIVKLSSSGTTEWRKTCGGSGNDVANSVFETSDGGYIVSGYSYSNNGDVSGNHSIGKADAWLVKLSFPGVPLLPTINITASETTICPGKNIIFIATSIDGGNAPSYQWKINGVNTATNNDTVIINAINNGDVLSCVLTSNSPCVSTPTAVSNSISISVDPLQTPTGFLPAALEICSYGNLELKPVGTYKTYLWNTNAATPTIIVNQPGTYWLDVTTNQDCPGSDTVIVTPKNCLIGLYMPTAFTPNNDGKNDLLKPIFGGIVKQYKLAVYNRWGQIVFQTTDPNKGWNGTFRELAIDSNIFVWLCIYQLEGGELKTESGTVTIIR